MSTFKQFRKIKSILSEIPGIRTYKDFDILLEIGYHQEEGCPLTLKQLLLLEIGSRATVRRYLSTLVHDGMVEKVVSPSDQRSVTLRLSAPIARTLTTHFSKIIEHLVDHPAESPRRSNGRNRNA